MDVLNINDLSIKEVEAVIGRSVDNVLVENQRVVCVFLGEGAAATKRVHIRRV